MAEYIDKSVLYEKIAQLEELARNRYLKTPSNSPCHSRYMEQLNERTFFKQVIADFPAADVEPVVRCRDCKYYYDYGVNRDYCCHRGKCGKQVFDVKFKADDFCSYGERKDGDGNG